PPEGRAAPGAAGPVSKPGRQSPQAGGVRGARRQGPADEDRDPRLAGRRGGGSSRGPGADGPRGDRPAGAQGRRGAGPGQERPRGAFEVTARALQPRSWGQSTNACGTKFRRRSCSRAASVVAHATWPYLSAPAFFLPPLPKIMISVILPSSEVVKRAPTPF